MDSPYRLLQISNHTLHGGGMEAAASAVAALLSREHQFQELVFESSEWTGADAPPHWKQAALMFYNPSAIRRIRDAQQRLSAQAWIVHNTVPVVSAGVYPAALRLGIPIVQFIHNFRPFSVSGYLWTGRTLRTSQWPLNFLREVRHGAWQGSRLKTAVLAAVFTTLHVTRQFRAIKAWIAVSDFMRTEFLSAGVPAQRVFRLYPSWPLRDNAPVTADGGYYLFLGRLAEEKGVAVLIRAWSILWERLGEKAPRLLVAGEGPLAKSLEYAAAGNPRIELCGVVTGSEKERLLACCRAVIQPAVCWEALSLVVYEAYDYGKPVLASASGGMTELVQDGVTGFRHEAGNAAEIARQVLELDRSAEARQKLGAAGREWLIRHGSEDVWRREFFAVVEHALAFAAADRARYSGQRRGAKMEGT